MGMSSVGTGVNRGDGIEQCACAVVVLCVAFGLYIEKGCSSKEMT